MTVRKRAVCIWNRISKTIVSGMAHSCGQSSEIAVVRDLAGAVLDREK
jgi:hypothetical protein